MANKKISAMGPAEIEDDAYLLTDGFAFSNYAARCAFSNTVVGPQALSWEYATTANRMHGLGLALRAI